MKKFKFKLETVLRLKERAEDLAKAELGRIQKEISSIDEKIVASNEAISQAYKEQDAVLASSTSATLSQFFPYFISSKRSQIEGFKKDKQNFIEQYKTKMTELVKAKAEVDLFEKMKSKQEKLYVKDQNKKMQNEIDDIMIARRAMEVGE